MLLRWRIGPHLFFSEYQGQTQLFVPELGELDQIDMLSNGDLIPEVSGDRTLVRITPCDERSVLASKLFSNDVRMTTTRKTITPRLHHPTKEGAKRASKLESLCQ